MTVLKKCTDHLHGVGESYTQHMGFAFYIGFTLIGAGIKAVLHALIPAIFQRSASMTIFRLADEIRARMEAAAKQ